MEYTAGEPCTECGALVEDVTVDREQVGIDIVGGFDFGWPTPVYGPPSMRLVPCGHQVTTLIAPGGRVELDGSVSFNKVRELIREHG